MLAGRYEEAIPSLKTYLASYSNNIGAHLMLINCYVELGRNEDVRAEAADVMRINPQFSLAAQKCLSSRDRCVTAFMPTCARPA
jgi:tetratricopeptide repeat protein